MILRPAPREMASEAPYQICAYLNMAYLAQRRVTLFVAILQFLPFNTGAGAASSC